MVGSKEREGKKTKNKMVPSLLSEVESLIPSSEHKKKEEKSEGTVDVSNVANNKEKKKEKKRKLDRGSDENDSHLARKKNKVSDDDREVSGAREGLAETHPRIEEDTDLQKNAHVDFISNSESNVRRDGKENHKERNREGRTRRVSSMVEDSRREKVAGAWEGPVSEDIARMNNGEQARKKEKKKKQKKREDGGADGEVIKNATEGKDVGRREEMNATIKDKVESPMMEEKRKKKKHNLALARTTVNQHGVMEGDEGDTSSTKNKAEDGKLEVNAEGEKKRKKAKSVENGSEGKSNERVTRTEKDDETTCPSEKSSSKVMSKRVSFCKDVEVFPSLNSPSDDKGVGEDGLVRGKRFSLEEDEMVKEAVLNYINADGLGAEGLNMVLNCNKHSAVKNCWKEIGAALPWRPRQSVYYRAHILFERDQNSSWTPEEYELIRKFHEKHGSDWKTLAEALGKHRFHVKDTWRRIKLTRMKKGKWSQDEYQSLFDLVNLDLRMKAFEERKTKHGMLRDNVSWTAISEKLETRTDALCCQKWYDQLTSPMVAEGKWLDTDDYRLLMELYDLDACCMEDVDWDNLLEHRSGDLCRKRWNQMVKHLGDHRNKSFAEQVDVLINRYCPDVLEAREAYYSKPAVP